MTRSDVIVIGAGVNGLAAAALLARHGRRVLVVERRDVIGGTMVTEEFHPGFRANICRDDPGWLSPLVLKEVRSAGALDVTWASAGMVVAMDGARPLATMSDAATTAGILRDVSDSDARRWEAFCTFVTQVASVLEAAYSVRPPDVRGRSPGDLLALAALGRRLRRVGKRAMMEVLRAVPMPIADLAEEWFEAPALRAALATLGVRDVLHGPLSSGTGLVFFHQHVGAPHGHVGVRRVVRPGLARLADVVAEAARAAGAEIRVSAPVQEITVRAGRVAGLVLESGEELVADTVVSSIDPRRTFALADPAWFDPMLLDAVDHVRMRGASARVHLALDGLPAFTNGGQAWSPEWLTGTIMLTPDVMGVERAYDAAKFGEMPERPAMTITLPSSVDPTLAPPSGHVLSATVHHVPWALRTGWTDAAREQVGQLVVRRLEEVAPGIGARIVGGTVFTPVDLEQRFGVSEGSVTQGEIALDQMLFMRPVPACARYATPLPGLWVCGTGTHPAVPGGISGILAARELLAQ